MFNQRFDSALRLAVHYHAIFADGVFCIVPGKARAEFHPIEQLTDAEVARTVRHIQRRVLRLLHRLGKLDDLGSDATGSQDPDALRHLHAAAAEGRAALGPNAGTPDSRPGRGTMVVQFRHGEGGLCADLDGFSLHAAVRIQEGRRDRLESLIHYVTRPPIADERLSIEPDGRIAYHFKKRWRDGSAKVVVDALTFIARLAALVHRPRKKIVNYFGVFAPAAADRDRVVPVRPIVNADTTAAAAGVVAAEASTAPPPPLPRCPHQPPGLEPTAPSAPDPADPSDPEAQTPPTSLPSDPPSAITAITRRRKPRFRGVPHAPRKPTRRRRYYFWHELLRRVFHIQALTCPRCGGPRRLLSFIQDQAVITRILEHLGLPTEPPELAPARPPPERSVHFV